MPLALSLAWLAVAETDCVTLRVGVWVTVVEAEEVCEAEDDAVLEECPEMLLEAEEVCVTLAVRLAWLAVKVSLAVADKEGQLPVADTVSVPLSVGD